MMDSRQSPAQCGSFVGLASGSRISRAANGIFWLLLLLHSHPPSLDTLRNVVRSIEKIDDIQSVIEQLLAQGNEVMWG